MATSLGVGGKVSGDTTMTAAQGRLADLAAINRGIKKKSPDDEAKEKAKQDSLRKVNNPIYYKAVDDADMDVLPPKKKN